MPRRRVDLRLPAELVERVDAAAARLRQTRTSLIATALTLQLDELEAEARSARGMHDLGSPVSLAADVPGEPIVFYDVPIPPGRR